MILLFTTWTRKVPVHIMLLVFIILMTSVAIKAQTNKKSDNAAFNEKCFKCHGQSKYNYLNPESGSEVTKRMYLETIINRDQFAESNHKNFKCTDCHSEDYDTFPHPGRLRMESKYACIDCHGGDEAYAKFKFEEIETEFQSSVHSTKHSDDFNCWM